MSTVLTWAVGLLVVINIAVLTAFGTLIMWLYREFNQQGGFLFGRNGGGWVRQSRQEHEAAEKSRDKLQREIRTLGALVEELTHTVQGMADERGVSTDRLEERHQQYREQEGD